MLDMLVHAPECKIRAIENSVRIWWFELEWAEWIISCVCGRVPIGSGMVVEKNERGDLGGIWAAIVGTGFLEFERGFHFLQNFDVLVRGRVLNGWFSFWERHLSLVEEREGLM